MTKIEITNSISKYLSKSPISLLDLLDKTIKIDSYEKYIAELTVIQTTYKDDIIEFYNAATSYLEKMEKFVNDCESISDDNIQTHIDGKLKNTICGSDKTV